MTLVDIRRREEPSGPFVIGSTVSLKGGGEVMTVRKPGKQAVLVDWHDGNGNLCTADFPPGMLRHADPDEEKDDANGSG